MEAREAEAIPFRGAAGGAPAVPQEPSASETAAEAEGSPGTARASEPGAVPGWPDLERSDYWDGASCSADRAVPHPHPLMSRRRREARERARATEDWMGYYRRQKPGSLQWEVARREVAERLARFDDARRAAAAAARDDDDDDPFRWAFG